MFSSTLKASLEMDNAKFFAGLSASEKRMVAFSENTTKSARASADVFIEIAAQEEKLNAARIQQAIATNQSITAATQSTIKSARESASVFQEIAAQEEKIADLRVQHAEAVNRSITAQQNKVTKSARESAAAFEAAWAAQGRGFFGNITAGITQLKRTLAPAGGGGLFMRFLGVGAAVGAFTSAISRAQELRAEATRLGRPLDESVARVAKLGDTFATVKDGVRDLGVSILGVATGIGETIGTQIVRLRALAQGKSIAEADAAVAASEQAGANADRLQAELANPTAKQNMTAAAAEREARRRRELNDFDLLNQLLADRSDLEKQAVDMSKPLVERTAARLALEKKITEITALGAKIDAEAAADRKRADEDAAARAADSEKNWADWFKRLDDMSSANIDRINAEKDASDKVAKQRREELEEERRQRFMTNEQKLAEVIKQGRAAQAELNANPKDEQAALKVEELRKKYLGLRDAITGANNARDGKGPADPDAADRGEDGKIRRNGAVVSQEDRNRTRATRARDAQLNAQTRSQQIQSRSTREANGPGTEFKTALSTTETYLKGIEAALTTSGTT